MMKSGSALMFLAISIIGVKTASGSSHGCPDELSTCEEFCGKKGYIGGECDEEDCICVKNPDTSSATKPASNPISNTENSHGCPRSVITCSKHCREHGYNFAVCYDNQCRCSEELEESTAIANETRVLQNSFECPDDQLQCALNCVILKYISGTCYKNQCVCRKSLSETNIPTTIRTTDNLLAMDTNGCPDDPSVCENYCSHLEYTRAKCSENQCICQSKSVITPSVPDNTDPEESHGCPNNVFTCHGHCRRNGHSLAECREDQCICGGKSPKNAEILKETPDTFILKNSLGCPRKPFACILQCISLNFSSANCNKNQCICLKNRLATSTKPEIVSQTLTTENSYGCPDATTSCNKYCIRKGYESAECTGKRCTCMRSSMAGMPKSTYTLDTPNSEFYEIPASKSLDNCRENPIECAENCINEGYVSAKCRNYECMCLTNVSMPNILTQALTTRSPDDNPFCEDYCKNFGFVFVDVIDGKCNCGKTVVNTNGASKTLTQTMTTDNSNGCPEKLFSCRKYCLKYSYNSAECKGSRCICTNPSTEEPRKIKRIRL